MWHSREGQREVEALAHALEGQEGLRGEVTGGHLAVGLLVAACQALAAEAAHQQVHTRAAVLTYARGTAARPGRQLTPLPCLEKGTERILKVLHYNIFISLNSLEIKTTTFKSS